MELLETMMEMLAAYAFIVLLMAVLQLVAMWKIFKKAGEEGWKAIIPIYNTAIQYKISGLSPWLILVVLLAAMIPGIGYFVSMAINIYSTYLLAKSFGKDIGYTLGLIFLGPIFYLMLAFGDAQYIGPAGPMANK